MAEISREDAIINIKAIRDLWDNEYDYKSEYRDFLEDDPIETLDKAISDMEKLEKIEKIFATCGRTVSDKVFNPKLVCEQIEQIVKEV